MSELQSIGSPNDTKRLRVGLRFTWSLDLILLLICCLTSGCAIHYGKARTGSESAWGIGRVTWNVKPTTNGWSLVSSGLRLPGVVLGVGPDFFGVSLGYHIHECLQVMPSSETNFLSAAINGHDLPVDLGHRWGIGHFRIETQPGNSIAVVTGSAVAGLSIATENSRPSFTLGGNTKQLTAISGQDEWIEFSGGTNAWPYFDFPSLHATVKSVTNETARTIAP